MTPVVVVRNRETIVAFFPSRVPYSILFVINFSLFGEVNIDLKMLSLKGAYHRKSVKAGKAVKT